MLIVLDSILHRFLSEQVHGVILTGTFAQHRVPDP